MSPLKGPKFIASLWQQGMQTARQFDGKTHGWLGILYGALRQTLLPDSVLTAAAIAYFALFSLFPLILLSIAIASMSLGSLMDQNQVIQRLEFIAPALGTLLGENIDEIVRARGAATNIALIGLLYSASTIFLTLTQTMSVIWGQKRRRSIWKLRGLPILLVLTFVGPTLFVLSFGSSMVSNLRTWLPVQMIPFWDGFGFLLVIILDVILFLVLYILLPHGESTWREVLPGAIGAGLLWEGAKKGFLLFITSTISTSNLLYGSVAAIISFLIWGYLSGLIFLFGAYISRFYYMQKLKQHEKVELLVEADQ
jgi:membrane protein